MKQLIRILVAGALTLIIFLNANSAKEPNKGFDLDSLAALNSADAECPDGDFGICEKNTAGVDTCWADSGNSNSCR